MLRQAGTFLLLSAVLLSGCSGNASPDGDDETPPGGITVKPTDTTGIIVGVVVDEAIQPVVDALVKLQGPGTSTETRTNDAGGFGFEDLAPGTYFVRAQKAGYDGVQQSVEVEAGVERPDVVKVLLTENPSTRPSFDVHVFEGFIECSATYVLFFSSCRNPVDGSPIGNNDYERNFPLAGDIDFLHVSLVWDPTQPIGTELYMNLCEDVGPCAENVGFTGGPGPLVLDVPAEGLGPVNAIGQFGIEVAGNGEQGTGVGVEVQQDFIAYGVAFRNFAPPEGYAFWRDGDPVVSG